MEKRELQVKDIMSLNPVVIPGTTPIVQIEEIFRKHNFWSVYVGNPGRFVGVITKDDLKNRGNKISKKAPAFAIMSKGVIDIDENSGVDVAKNMLIKHNINGLAVTRNGKHIGIITRYDIKTKTTKEPHPFPIPQPSPILPKTSHHDVFISYAHNDKPIADAICASLESEGIRCWIAPRDVTPGKDYASEIIDAIDSSRIMIMVFSSNSNNSTHVIKELDRAISKVESIIPFRIEDVPLSKSMIYYLTSPLCNS